MNWVRDSSHALHLLQTLLQGFTASFDWFNAGPIRTHCNWTDEITLVLQQSLLRKPFYRATSFINQWERRWTQLWSTFPHFSTRIAFTALLWGANILPYFTNVVVLRLSFEISVVIIVFIGASFTMLFVSVFKGKSCQTGCNLDDFVSCSKSGQIITKTSVREIGNPLTKKGT